MYVPLNKYVIKQKVSRFAGAFVYLLATFVVPLTHTCHLHQSSMSTCDFNHAHRSCCSEARGVEDAEPASKQESPIRGSLSYGHQCIACIYFSTCTATEVIRGGVTLNIPDVPTCVASSHSSRPLKQPEWTSSIILRAPPFATS